MRSRAPLVLVVAASLMSGFAAASEGYPEAMKTDLGLAMAPGCDLCHQAAESPVGPASTLFGKSTVAHGLVALDTASLAKALDALRTAGIDSDDDGAKDLDELSWGGDPNHADVPEGANSEPLTYGCSSGRVPVEGGGAGVLLGVIAILAMRPRHRRRSAAG